MFIVTPDKNGISMDINFTKIIDCDAVARLEFCSRLLHSLKPDDQGVWQNTNSSRVPAYIKGFPQNFTWERPSESQLKVTSSTPISSDLMQELKSAINGLLGTKKSDFEKIVYNFDIVLVDRDTTETYSYRFDNRSRPIVAFCVLWDCESHPRNHLEVTCGSNVKLLMSKSKPGTRLYGDPSKTVDELRNQGFPRESDQSLAGTFINVEKKQRHGTVQEHYMLLNREQSLQDQVGRSQIPNSYKTKLYEKYNSTCANCGQRYEHKYLAPDHRVPSIVESDDLSAMNYLTKLQTLCVRCNQVKRESCKKCPYEHKCRQCEWAFPEKYGVSASQVRQLRQLGDKKGLTAREMLKELIDKYS